MARTIIILAIAGDSQVAIDSNVVFGLARQGGAIEPLPSEPRGPFQVQFQALANYVTDHPIKPSRLSFHHWQTIAIWREQTGTRSSADCDRRAGKSQSKGNHRRKDLAAK